MVDGCHHKRFSHGYCKSHQWMRTDNKKPKPIKKVSEKGKIKRQEKAALFHEDVEFYLSVWEIKYPHKCYNCDKELSQPLLLYFDHILEKGNEKYKHLRYEILNICYLCWVCHTDKSNGILSDKLKALRESTITLLIKD